ncbi:cupin domain-containing protein [Gammaproteobacteria bacterium]|nr:cupin domain-containing protein [Gammaproteobacteria bacterium]
MNKKENFVAVSGGFDPLHSGHISLFKDASKYGKVIAIINNDNFLLRKKKYIFMPIAERLNVVSSNKYIEDTFVSIDQDDTVSSSIQHLIDSGFNIKYFANGGDRETRFDIPESDVCTKNNIELIFGVGGGKTQSSSELTQNLFSLMSSEKLISKHIKTKQIIQKPWGSYQTLYEEDKFLLKKLIINPGEEISNQFHNYRHEHWVLVSGNIEVILEDQKTKMSFNDYIYIPRGSKHQIINPFNEPSEIIEIQSGEILSEDDIVRLSDKYQRSGL